MSALMIALALSGGALTSESWGAAVRDYVLQAGDVLNVSVWREPDLDRTLLVRPDGGISFPLAGDLMAAGKTVNQLTADLSGRLTKYIPSPVVTVTLQENLGNRIYVTGRVSKPGVYLLNQDVTVTQALAMAGGLTPFAKVKDIQILRREGDVERAIPFNYKQVQRGKHLEQNIILRPGDTVLVP
ncbi:MAG: polysaccharide biosynthesis/export family protein [Chromatiaceae bacterium]